MNSVIVHISLTLGRCLEIVDLNMLLNKVKILWMMSQRFPSFEGAREGIVLQCEKLMFVKIGNVQSF